MSVAYELIFTKEDAEIIAKKSDSEGIVCDLKYLQTEVDKLIEKWKEEVMFL